MMPAKCGAFHHKEKQCLIYRSQASERKSFHLPRLSGSRCRLPMPRAIYQVNLDQPMLKHDVALKCQIAQFISLPICHMSHTKKSLLQCIVVILTRITVQLYIHGLVFNGTVMPKRKVDDYFKCYGIRGVNDAAVRRVVQRLRDEKETEQHCPSFAERFQHLEGVLHCHEESGICTLNLQVYMDTLAEKSPDMKRFFQETLVAQHSGKESISGCLYADEAVPGQYHCPRQSSTFMVLLFYMGFAGSHTEVMFCGYPWQSSAVMLLINWQVGCLRPSTSSCGNACLSTLALLWKTTWSSLRP